MKAYILKLTFQDIQPEVWRRIILPAGATFNRLHETIQYVTNFQSEMEPYHYFGIEIEDLFITNNQSLLEEYKGKSYNSLTVKQPTRIKIDNYLEKHRELLYQYDFGDDWRIKIELEETVEDYHFGFPTLLDGEGMAPPEDVGGPAAFEEFLKIYQTPSHPEYLSTYAWAEKMEFLPFERDEINFLLKHVKYKKTEWEHIDHDNYFILSDKYRGSDYVDVEALPNKDIIIQYATACTNLYGIIKYPDFLKIYNSQNKPSLSSKELQALLSDPQYEKELENHFVYIEHPFFIHEAVEMEEDFVGFVASTIGKPFYVPAKKELLRYTDQFYYEKTSHQEKLAKMLAKDFFGGNKLKAKDEIDEIVGELQVVDADFNGLVREFMERFVFDDMKQANEYIQVITKIANTTRIWENRGHTPEELSKMSNPQLNPIPTTPLKVMAGGKVGRNDPCPCGSGKKYKKCCGK
ncbi:SEC-C metal-binding domain-containing protein [Ureibacillus composti]|nr:SEC-C metal-binding domain-containing protein [Ureibacillus composti]